MLPSLFQARGTNKTEFEDTIAAYGKHAQGYPRKRERGGIALAGERHHD